MVRAYLVPLINLMEALAFFRPARLPSYQIWPGQRSHARRPRAGSRYPTPFQGNREKARRRRQQAQHPGHS